MMSDFDKLPDAVRFKNIGGYAIFSNGIVMKPDGCVFKPANIDKRGAVVWFRVGSRQKNYNVKRLVAELFLPNPKGFPHVIVKDGNEMNCDVNNLEWCDKRSRRFKKRYSEAEIKDILKTIKKRDLSSIHLAIYKYLKGKKSDFVGILYDNGNQRYLFTVIINELKKFGSEFKYNFESMTLRIKDYVLDSIESLIQRGYFLPVPNCSDAKFWCYVREFSKKTAFSYITRERTRALIDSNNLKTLYVVQHK